MSWRTTTGSGTKTGRDDALRSRDMGLAFGFLVALAAFSPQQAVSEPYFRFNSTFSRAAPEGPGTPGTPETPVNDTLAFGRSAFEGERNVQFGTGLPTSTLPTPVDYSLASDSAPLPGGLSVEKNTGEIAGTPTELGTFPNIVIAGVSGTRSAKSAPSTIVITGLVPGADEVLPSSATIPNSGTSKLNVSHLLGQYVPYGKPRLDPGASLEIIYSQPVQVDGVQMSTLNSSPSYRVDAEVGGSWRTIRSGITQAKGAQPIPLGSAVTAPRFRIVNTGTAALTNLTAGVTYNGKWAQLPVMTVDTRFAKLTVGQSFSAGVSLYTGPMGYGEIVSRLPFTYSMTPRAVDMPQVEDAYFQNPPGIDIDSSSGTVSGTASAPTWAGWTTGAPGMLMAQTRRDTYIRAVDADGYTVYGWGRTFVVDSPVSAGSVVPSEITVNGTPVDEASRLELVRLTAGSFNLPAGSQIISKYSGHVSAGALRIRWTGTQANWSVFFSQDNGAHWMPVEDTETTSAGITTLALADPLMGTGTGNATGRWIMAVPNRGTTLRGIVIGKDGVFPAP